MFCNTTSFTASETYRIAKKRLGLKLSGVKCKEPLYMNQARGREKSAINYNECEKEAENVLCIQNTQGNIWLSSQCTKPFSCLITINNIVFMKCT